MVARGVKMSFVAPYSTMGGKTFWTNTVETDELIWQDHKTPSIWWSAPKRIVIKESGVCIAEGKTDAELVTIWEQAIELVDATKDAMLVSRLAKRKKGRRKKKKKGSTKV